MYHLPDGGTGDDDRGKGLAKSEWSEVSIVSGRSVSETCLEDEVAPREDGLLLGVDILKLFYLKKFSGQKRWFRGLFVLFRKFSRHWSLEIDRKEVD